jgi:hypothetical protein
LILDRMIDARSVGWARWIVLPALCGFVGSLMLTLVAHEPNGVFQPPEWVGAVAGA